MLITARLRYAVIVMVHLANSFSTSVKLSSIPRKLYGILSIQFVQERHLEHVIFLLRRSGVFSTIKGREGRCYTSCLDKSVTINKILGVIEEVKITRYDGIDILCIKGQVQCKTHTLRSSFGDYAAGDYLDKTSLKELFDKSFDVNIGSPLGYQNSSKYVYADYNSTAPINGFVRENVSRVLSYEILNPSSVHQAGQKVRKVLQNARDDIRDFVSAPNSKQILFTSSATEANNLVMKGIKGYAQVISAIEHPSIARSADNPYIIPVDCNGIVNLIELRKTLCILQEKKVLVSVMMANNETGVIQPIKEIVEISHEFGAICHTDAVQACGKIDVNVEDLGADLITLSAHKIGGLPGVGALIFDKNLRIEPIITGGGQEKGLRAGTENVIAIASFSSALKQAYKFLKKTDKIRNMRDRLESKILKIANNAVIFGRDVKRLPNTSCIYMPDVKSDVQLITFDTNNIAVSGGSACSLLGKLEPSYVLLAMGATKEQAECSIRISIGWNTTDDDIERILSCWYNIYKNNTKLVQSL